MNKNIKKRFLVFTATMLVLCQLLSGCMIISPSLTSTIGSAISQAMDNVEDESISEQSSLQESDSSNTKTPDSQDESTAAQSSVNPLFWEVTSEQYSGHVYLFGSIHAARADAYPLPQHITDAFETSDTLAVECDTIAFEDNSEQQIAALQSIVYLDGTTIYDHLSEDNYYLAVDVLRNYGLYESQYEYYKPTLWTSLFDSYIINHSSLSYDFGLDEFFIRQAKQSGKNLIEIESVEFQYDMIGGFSDRLQELMLEGYLYDGAIDDQLEALEQLYDDWASGNVQGLSNESDNSETDIPEEDIVYYEEYTEKMLTSRNLRMADAAESYLKQGMDVFLVVGSAHMLDDGGIVQLLRERGYTVTEYQNRY